MRYLAFLFLLCFSSFAIAQSEISLYDSDGEATAYINTEDGTIYLWEGSPVAYLHAEDQVLHVYGFNGAHLGWFADGMVRDHDGDVVGVTEDATTMYTGYDPYKPYKEPKPYKDYREYAPYKPYFTNSWSSVNFSLFLIQGISE
jgi:hypothetical protein